MVTYNVAWEMQPKESSVIFPLQKSVDWWKRMRFVLSTSAASLFKHIYNLQASFHRRFPTTLRVYRCVSSLPLCPKSLWNNNHVYIRNTWKNVPYELPNNTLFYPQHKIPYSSCVNRTEGMNWASGDTGQVTLNIVC